MITRPAWAKGAYPTERGWNRGKELLTVRRHTPEEVAEWNEANNKVLIALIEESKVKFKKVKAPRKKKVKEVKESSAVSLTEAPVSNKAIGDMTKPQIESIENQYGVKIDPNANKTLMESSDKE